MPDSSFGPQNAKITVFFFLIIILILIFLGKIFFTFTTYKSEFSIKKTVNNRAKRGSIISADNFVITSSKKLYKAIINKRNLDLNKKNLFATLFSIYSGIPLKSILQKINKAKGRITLSFSINETKAKQLKSLAYKLLKLKVFKRYETINNHTIYQGLDILESGETRQFPYNDLLTPIIGYVHKYEKSDYTRVKGIKGLEKFYQNILNSMQKGLKQGERDVNNYLILNKDSIIRPTLDGPSIILNIPVFLQRRAEFLVSKAKKKYGAKEVMCSIMESSTGKIIVLASSNRFNPNKIHKKDYSSLNSNFVEYSFEPGSVIKPFVFARLLEHKKIKLFDIINTHNGKFKIGKKVITDDHKYAFLSAENVLVHSSNVGMAQMVQKIGAINLHQGLIDFGFTQKSGVDLPFEKRGVLPSIKRLNSTIYKATVSYGYGLTANFMQLLKAYNLFNNNGIMISPKIALKIYNQGKERLINNPPNIQALNSLIANRMKKILIKVVNNGTGAKAAFKGLEVGGKTGTAHIAEKGSYVRKFHSSFFGFVNDQKSKYTIGVTLIEPNEHYYFGSSSAAPIFRSLIKLLVEFDFLKPKLSLK